MDRKNETKRPALLARLKEGWAAGVVLFFAALIIAAGLLIPDLLLQKRKERLLLDAGLAETQSVDPYSHRTQAERVHALYLRFSSASTQWDSSRSAFGNELTDVQARRFARAILESLPLPGADSMLLREPALLCAPEDPTLSVWLIQAEGAALYLDAVSGLPVYASAALDTSALDTELETLWLRAAEAVCTAFPDFAAGPFPAPDYEEEASEDGLYLLRLSAPLGAYALTLRIGFDQEAGCYRSLEFFLQN